MGELSSNLFTTGDPNAVNQLENCANGRPTEVQSHFIEKGPGFQGKGEAVLKLKQALQNARNTADDLKGMPNFAVTSNVYDKDFGDAIAFYKGKRQILNFAGKVDRVVGIKTVRKMSTERGGSCRPSFVDNPTCGDNVGLI